MVKHHSHGKAYVKIDGKPTHHIFVGDDLHVWAVFTDMSVKKGWNDSVSKPENIRLIPQVV